MPSIWKRFSQPKAELYQFISAEELLPEEPPPAPEPEEPEEDFLPEEPEETEAPPPEKEVEPDVVSYAQIQAASILADAEQRAEQLLADARREAERVAEEIREAARQSGWEAGHVEGVAAGNAQAMEENRLFMEEQRRAREAEAAALAEEIKRFLERADAALNQQLDENIEQLRDLAIAIAEKVVCVSLKSSSEVIGRMIQAAVDKRRRREWVHIYIAECDAKHLAEIPPSLMAALSELSDRVRIIPMADDEAGTCIVEMPDEIIDASAATQMNNIRNMLSDMPVGGREAIFQRRRSVDRVPTNGPAGL